MDSRVLVYTKNEMVVCKSRYVDKVQYVGFMQQSMFYIISQNLGTCMTSNSTQEAKSIQGTNLPNFTEILNEQA